MEEEGSLYKKHRRSAGVSNKVLLQVLETTKSLFGLLLIRKKTVLLDFYYYETLGQKLQSLTSPILWT